MARRKLPPLNALAAFDAAARHSSFTRAAKELGVAQPAVTRHIANLESWLGVSLFDRTGSVVRLTAAGGDLAETVGASLDRIEMGVQSMPRPRQEIVLGASFGVMHLWLMPRLAAMRAATPATVNFVTADSYADFTPAQVDASIQFTNGTPDDVLSDFLFAEQCYVLASPAFLDAHPDLSPHDLINTLQPEWLLDHGDPHSAGWMTWQTWYRLQNVPPPRPDRWREVRNYPAMLDMVRHGEGVALGSVGLDDALVDGGEILRLGAPLGRPDRGYRLVYNAHVMQKMGFAELRAALCNST